MIAKISSTAYADRLFCYYFVVPTYTRNGTVSEEEVQIDLVENLPGAIRDLKRKLSKREIDLRRGPAFVTRGNERAYSQDPAGKWGRKHQLPKNWSI